MIKKGDNGIAASRDLQGLQEGEKAAEIEETHREKKGRGYLLHLPYESRDV